MKASTFIETKLKPLINSSGTSKWTNARFVEIINEGMEELAKEAAITRDEYIIPVLPYTREVDLPSDFLNLTEVKYNDLPVTTTTFDKIKKEVGNWESVISDNNRITHVIIDRQDLGKLTVYPLLSEAAINFTALSDATGIIMDIPGVTQDNIVGLITSVDTLSYITPENVYDPSTIPNEGGGLTSVSHLFGFLTIKYVYKPKEILVDALDDELDISDTYLTALKYYCAGHLLLDEGRNEALNKSSVYIKRYISSLEEVKSRTGSNFQNIHHHEVKYRTPFGD